MLFIVSINTLFQARRMLSHRAVTFGVRTFALFRCIRYPEVALGFINERGKVD